MNILLSATLGHELNILLGTCGLILIIGLVLRKFNQPYIVAYILTGVLIGPFGFQLVSDQKIVEMLGELGLVVLMFFIGMEISLKDFIKKWRVALFGTGFQVLFSIILAMVIGLVLDWPFKRILLIGFVISLSSSAVVIKLVDDLKLGDSKIGQNVISILLTQDILIVPMIIIMSFLGGKEVSVQQIALQLVGGAAIVAVLVYILNKEVIRMPFDKYLRFDHELQVFASLIACFGMALFTSFFDLSAGLGAFVAGLFFHASPTTKWLHDSLHSFRVVLISIFFLSIGMLIDLQFLKEQWLVVSILVVVVYLTNHGINAGSLKILGNSWRESLFGASLLAQVGEFSFVLVSLGYQSEILSLYSYNLTVMVISITIVLSPFWVSLNRYLTKVEL